MKIAIYSDVHSNLEAFNAVLKDIQRQNVDQKIFLGDIVGYGPNPNECIELMKENADYILAGNHDWAAVGLTDTSYFNIYANASLDWTISALSDENKEFLKEQKPRIVLDGIHIAHSTPRDPEQWNYIMTLQDASHNYDYIEKDFCFIGHSHQPVIVEMVDASNILPIRDIYKTLEPNRRYIINVGSVGQPRDSNPDACYLTFDTQTKVIEYRRVAYDIKRVQRKMKKQKLPQYLIERLESGR